MSRFERKERLERYLLEEAHKFKTGELPAFPTASDTAQQLNYSVRRIRELRNILGINDAIKAHTEQAVKEKLQPSRVMARMIGMMCGKGSFEGAVYSIESNRQVDLQEALKTEAEKTLGVTVTQSSRTHDGKPSNVYSFNNRTVIDFLGNLDKNNWPETLREKHPWIFEDNTILWGLVEGYFESHGTPLQRGPSTVNIALSAHTESGLNLLQSSFSSLGVERSVKHYDDNGKPHYVNVGNLKDVKLIAHNIHSELPRKEKVLQAFRETKPRDFIPYISVLKEWVRVVNMLGHQPSFSELIMLRRNGETLYGPTVYERTFGDGSYARAAEELNKHGEIANIIIDTNQFTCSLENMRDKLWESGVSGKRVSDAILILNTLGKTLIDTETYDEFVQTAEVLKNKRLEIFNDLVIRVNRSHGK